MSVSQAPSPDVALCVSLCETVPSATPDYIEAMLATTCAEAGFPHCERLYVGSYFCENFFLQLADELHESVRQVCLLHDMRATLVVPIIGQAFLGKALARLADTLMRFADVYDEVIVNDIGLFSDLANWYAGLGGLPAYDPVVPAIESQARRPRIGLGRLFAKGMRDARYPELFEQAGKPRLSDEAATCLHLQGELDPTSIPLVEIDPTNAIVDVSSLMDDIASVFPGEGAGLSPSSGHRAFPELAIHLPFCYATTGRNCSVAAIDERDSERFRLGRSCSQHCLRLRQGYRTEGGILYLKHGRTYYFENPACRIAGTDSWRIVYAATHETMRPVEQGAL